MAERNGRFCLVVNPAAGRGRSLRMLPEVTAVHIRALPGALRVLVPSA
jgi:diacylglycerol kinase family enzyme